MKNETSHVTTRSETPRARKLRAAYLAAKFESISEWIADKENSEKRVAAWAYAWSDEVNA